MAVVVKYARSYKDPASIALPEPAQAEGRVRCASSGPIAVANGDSIGSRVYLAKVASNAIILPHSQLRHSAVTGLTSVNIGLEQSGTVIDADILAAALDCSAAGTKDLLASVAIANLGKRLWEIAGLTVDPGYEYDIVATFAAAAGAAGTLNAFVYYAKK